MNTNLTLRDHLMIITVLAGFILAVLAFVMPVAAEAGVRVDARIGNVDVSVATGTPRATVLQTGPRTYRCDVRVRPPRPARGHYVWVPGHFEKVLEVRNCRMFHDDNIFRPGNGHSGRTKRDPVVKVRHGRKAPRHDHYREMWVPGRWVRI